MSLSQQFSLLPNIEALWNFSCAVQKGGARVQFLLFEKQPRGIKKPQQIHMVLGWAERETLSLFCATSLLFTTKNVCCVLSERIWTPQPFLMTSPLIRYSSPEKK